MSPWSSALSRAAFPSPSELPSSSSPARGTGEVFYSSPPSHRPLPPALPKVIPPKPHKPEKKFRGAAAKYFQPRIWVFLLRGRRRLCG